MSTTAIHFPVKRALLMSGAIVLVLVAALLLVNRRGAYRFSIEEKVNISALANRICKAAAAASCPIEWGGTQQGFGTLAKRGTNPVATLEQIRSALASSMPKWSEAVTSDSHVFTNGRYSVAYSLGNGNIVITSLK